MAVDMVREKCSFYLTYLLLEMKTRLWKARLYKFSFTRKALGFTMTLSIRLLECISYVFVD